MEFLKQYWTWIVGAVIIVTVVFQFVKTFMKARKIDQEGIEADARISKIEFMRGDEDTSDSYTAYVVFKGQDGLEHECNAGFCEANQYREGQPVRIKYIPGEYDLVRIMR